MSEYVTRVMEFGYELVYNESEEHGDTQEFFLLPNQYHRGSFFASSFEEMLDRFKHMLANYTDNDWDVDADEWDYCEVTFFNNLDGMAVKFQIKII